MPRAGEHYHRVLAGEAHMKPIRFCDESRHPGFYYQMDFNVVDGKNGGAS